MYSYHRIFIHKSLITIKFSVNKYSISWIRASAFFWGIKGGLCYWRKYFSKYLSLEFSVTCWGLKKFLNIKYKENRGFLGHALYQEINFWKFGPSNPRNKVISIKLKVYIVRLCFSHNIWYINISSFSFFSSCFNNNIHKMFNFCFCNILQSNITFYSFYFLSRNIYMIIILKFFY